MLAESQVGTDDPLRLAAAGWPGMGGANLSARC